MSTAVGTQKVINSIRIVVPGAPAPQPRQRNRAMVINGRAVSHNYTPKDAPVQQYKAAVAMAAQAAGLPETLWDGPVSLQVTFHLPRPKRLMRRKDPDGPVPHTSKPDTDNLVKAVKDALTGVLWRDDSLIWDESIRKVYHAKDGRPSTEIVAVLTGADGSVIR